MRVANPGQALAIVSDYTLTTDVGLDESEPEHAPHVLDMWRYGRHVLARAWPLVSRVALWRPTDTPTTREAAQRREEFVAWLVKSGVRKLFVLPTPDASLGGPAMPLRGTQAWIALGPPDTIDAMRGTRWLREGVEVTVGYPLAKRSKELHRWCNARWLRALGGDTLRPETDNVAHMPSEHMLDLMAAMAGRPLAVDLEFHPGEDIVTAVGLSDGVHAVSLPMDSYYPRNNPDRELGLSEYELGRPLLEAMRTLLAAPTAKVAHNFVADIPRLERRNLNVGGPLHDTFAAHAIAFPELRHGLQHAAASMLPCPPWKSLYKPSRLARGITRDDVEYWTARGDELRRYNYLDAFYTLNLARSVLPHVGVSLG